MDKIVLRIQDHRSEVADNLVANLIKIVERDRIRAFQIESVAELRQVAGFLCSANGLVISRTPKSAVDIYREVAPGAPDRLESVDNRLLDMPNIFTAAMRVAAGAE